MKRTQSSQKVDRIHDFIFDSLLPGRKYLFYAEALQIDDESKSISGVSDDPASTGETFTTSDIGVPNVTVDVPRKNIDNIVIVARSSQEVFAEISYTPYLPGGGLDTAKRKQIGSTNCDSFTGECVGSEVVPPGNIPKTFTIPNLEPGNYKVELTFKNRIGKRAILPDPEYTLNLPIPTPPINFDFSEEAIIAKVTPLGIEVKWTATDTPDTGSAQYLRDDGSTLTGGAKPTISGKTITVLFPPEDVTSIIKLQKAPTLELTMTKGGKLPLRRRMKFSFSLPTKEEVNAAGLQKDVKESILKIIKSKENPREQFKWADVLKAGLTAFLAL